MYFMFFGQLGMALGAGESGHPYSPIGVSRGLAQMTAFEVPFVLSVIAIAIQHNSLSVTAIVEAQRGAHWFDLSNWVMVTNPFAVIAAMFSVSTNVLVSLLNKKNRIRLKRSRGLDFVSKPPPMTVAVAAKELETAVKLILKEISKGIDNKNVGKIRKTRRKNKKIGK